MNMIENLPITYEEVVYGAILALCLTVMIKNFIRVRQILKNAKELAQKTQSAELGSVMSRCYSMFPIDEIMFHGNKFTRGMRVKITTIANTYFEGEFIGGNEKNMLCIKTNKYIIAHELKNISDITVIENN